MATDGSGAGEFRGFSVSYDQDEAPFPVYVAGGLSAILLAGAIASGLWVLFILGVLAFAVAYYNFPVIERGRPQMGANEYGIFIQGFGIIRWGAVDHIDLVPIAVRVLTIHELQIALKVPLDKALIADWRRLPWHRLLMRLPWRMTYNNIIRIRLDPLDKPPEDIHRVFLRMWRYYRS